MPWLDKFSQYLLVIWIWLRRTPYVTQGAIVLSGVVLLVCQSFGYHKLEAEWFSDVAAPTHFNGWVEPPQWMMLIDYLRPYLKLSLKLGTLVLMVEFIRTMPSTRKMVLPVFIFCLALSLLAILSATFHEWHVLNYSFAGEPRSTVAIIGKTALLVALIMSLPLMVLWYSKSSILERYTLSSFLQPLIFCFAAFGCLWVLMDIIDVMKDFQQAGIKPFAIAGLYLDMLPFIYVTVMPASLLLAVLYALTRMSRSNEIIAMLTSGLSLGQILKPMLIVTAYASAIGMVANYHWAPRAKGLREDMLSANSSNSKHAKETTTASVMYYHQPTMRTWFVGRVPFDLLGDKLRSVEVHQTDKQGRLEFSLYAQSARWWPTAKLWSFYKGVEITYTKGVAVTHIPLQSEIPENSGEFTDRKDITKWTETPWTIISAAAVPDNLGVPELMSYLSSQEKGNEQKKASFRAHLYQRFALPWEGFIIVLTSAPLGIAFSRRGSLGGVANCRYSLLWPLVPEQFLHEHGQGRAHARVARPCGCPTSS